MDSQFVPLTTLLASKPPAEQKFLELVVKRDLNPDGTDKGIYSRMQNDQCRRCHEEYKKKFPGVPFSIKCRGIYNEDFFKQKQQQMEVLGEAMSLEQIREIYDPAYWGESHIVTKNSLGDFGPFKPRWYQAESLRCTSPRKVDRWGRGMGKRLNIDTPIPTPAGWTTMGDVKVGDDVFDADGSPTKVTYVSPILMAEDTYEVVFSDGSIIHADAEHLWETWTHSARKAEGRKSRRTGKLAHVRPVPKPEVRTTEEIRQTLLHGNGKRVEHNHSIKLCGALQYSERSQPIHPYVFGYWLGDGSSGTNNITTADQEVLDRIKGLGYEIEHLDRYTWIVTIPGTKGTQSSFRSHLNRLGVLKNYHLGDYPKHSKFIPDDYLHGSVEQRVELLWGLMDADGTCCKKQGHCSFASTCERLAYGVFELAAGLGLKPTVAEKKKASQHGTAVTAWEVKFTPHIRVFGLSRKASRQKISVRSTQFHRYIVEVRKAKPALMRCIAVDNPRHLYLAGRSCIPTHNTMQGICEELHLSLTRKNFETAIVCPQQTQAEQWYTEILTQIENSPSLSDVLAGQKQSPYYLLRFNNGSIIKIFTAGSGSGKKGGSIRGQNPRRIRLDEQDFLAEADYDAIMPLLRRFKELTFHGSSTPTGLRGMYYRMCREFMDHKEFFHPISDHPEFSEEMKEACMREAKTTERYLHEFMAEFGTPAAGVFKDYFIEKAIGFSRFSQADYAADKRHVMGVDWNSQGTGTRIYVVQYDPSTRARKTVDHSVVDEPDTTTVKSIAEIKRLNKKWMCDQIYVDAGFGASQDELIRLEGKAAGKLDPQTFKLQNIKKIDFGGSLVFNKLVPNREPGEKKKKSDKDEDEEKRRTKPFMVEGAVMAFEQELVELSKDDDRLLIEQMRGYRVKTWSAHGMPASYITDSESGDHDLDAFMLAMLGIEIEYGLYQTQEAVRRIAKVLHVASWGVASYVPPTPSAAPQLADPSNTSRGVSLIENLRSKLDIPTRAIKTGSTVRVSSAGRSSVFVSPNGGSVPLRSRTDAFRNPPSMGTPQQGKSPFNTIGQGLIFGPRFPLGTGR